MLMREQLALFQLRNQLTTTANLPQPTIDDSRCLLMPEAPRGQIITDGQTERVNQELKQYLRVFTNHRQEQWPKWLAIAEFVYNNKVHSATQMLLFKANYR